jgi:hypothetical protein
MLTGNWCCPGQVAEGCTCLRRQFVTSAVLSAERRRRLLSRARRGSRCCAAVHAWLRYIMYCDTAMHGWLQQRCCCMAAWYSILCCMGGAAADTMHAAACMLDSCCMPCGMQPHASCCTARHCICCWLLLAGARARAAAARYHFGTRTCLHVRMWVRVHVCT